MFYGKCLIFVNHQRFLFHGGTKYVKLYVKDLYNSNPPLNQYLSTVRFIESKLRVYIKDLHCKRFCVK